MKNYKIWLIIVLALIAVNSVVLAVMWFHKRPENRHGHEEQRPAEPKDVLIQALALTAQQQNLFAAMRAKHQQTVRKLNEEGHALHDSLFSYIKKPIADSTQINAITKKISDTQVGVEKATLYHFRELRAILTDEQKSKFDGIIGDVLQMMSRPGQRRRPPLDNKEADIHPDDNRTVAPHPNREHRQNEGRPHFSPPPNGMPLPPGDPRRGHHPPPPPDGMPPGPGGPPQGGPPPEGPPPN